LENLAEGKWNAQKMALRDRELRKRNVDACMGKIGDWVQSVLRNCATVKEIARINDRLMERLSDVKKMSGYDDNRWGIEVCDLLTRVERARNDAADVGKRRVKLRNWFVGEIKAKDRPVDVEPYLREYDRLWAEVALDVPEMGPCTDEERTVVRNIGAQILDEMAYRQSDKAWYRIAKCIETSSGQLDLAGNGDEVVGIMTDWESRWKREFPRAKQEYMIAIIDLLMRRASRSLEDLESNCRALKEPEEAARTFNEQSFLLKSRITDLLTKVRMMDSQGVVMAPLNMAVRLAGEKLGRDIWQPVIWQLWSISWMKLQNRLYEDRWTKIDQSLVDEFIGGCSTRGISAQCWPGPIAEAIKSNLGLRRMCISKARPPSMYLTRGYVDPRPPDDCILA
jgi:hypothetical protein